MLKAPEFKRWISKKCGIPLGKLRVQTSKHYVEVRIVPDTQVRHMDPLVYTHLFKLDFGIKCLKQAYPDHPTLQVGWCGNVRSHMIAMSHEQWEKMIEAEELCGVN